MNKNESYFLLNSERLSLRKLTLEDITAWTLFFKNNDRLHFLGIDVSKSHEVLATEWIERQLQRYETEGLGHLAIESIENGEFIGLGGILPRVIDGKQEYEIAYSLFKDYWGNGYATELAQMMFGFGKEHIKTDQFISIIHVDNEASKNVALKNGMNPLYEMNYLGMDVIVYGRINDCY